MSDLHPDHVTPVLALEDQDACSPLVLRSAGLQAAKIIRKLTNDLGYREQEITRLRADLAAAQEREQRMREALERIAEYLPSFDYVGRDEFGPRVDFPGSPYDRGKADASKHLSEIARPAAGAEDALRVGRAIRASFGTVSQPAAIEKIGRAALAAMGYEVRD